MARTNPTNGFRPVKNRMANHKHKEKPLKMLSQPIAESVHPRATRRSSDRIAGEGRLYIALAIHSSDRVGSVVFSSNDNVSLRSIKSPVEPFGAVMLEIGVGG